MMSLLVSQCMQDAFGKPGDTACVQSVVQIAGPSCSCFVPPNLTAKNVPVLDLISGSRVPKLVQTTLNLVVFGIC